jgi:hypothetical protein
MSYIHTHNISSFAFHFIKESFIEINENLFVTKNVCINSKTVLLSKNKEVHQIFGSATRVHYHVIQFIGFQDDTNIEKGTRFQIIFEVLCCFKVLYLSI